MTARPADLQRAEGLLLRWPRSPRLQRQVQSLRIQAGLDAPPPRPKTTRTQVLAQVRARIQRAPEATLRRILRLLQEVMS